jgi:8-amino-7-oxononanoate synthase
LPNDSNVGNNLKRPASEPEHGPVLAGDIFDKAFGFTRADEAMAMGVYPYFKAIAEQKGGKVKVDGREMIITGSNDYLGLTQDPRLIEAAVAVFDRYGTSCTGSRFLTGRSRCTKNSSSAWPSSSAPKPC